MFIHSQNMENYCLNDKHVKVQIWKFHGTAMREEEDVGLMEEILHILSFFLVCVIHHRFYFFANLFHIKHNKLLISI